MQSLYSREIYVSLLVLATITLAFSCKGKSTILEFATEEWEKYFNNPSYSQQTFFRVDPTDLLFAPFDV